MSLFLFLKSTNFLGTLTADSEIVKSNQALRTYHGSIMQSISKIILATKIAAGLWPPPDAVHSMRYQAGQVLLAVRHFVAVAQDVRIVLKPVPPQVLDEFDAIGNQLTDQELISRLDQNSEIIMNSIASLITKITKERVLSNNLIELIRKTVVEVGQFMSLIEDIPFDPNSDVENLVADFKTKKQELYIYINALVTSSSIDNGVSGTNPLGSILENATAVLEGVEDVLVAAKLLMDHEEFKLQKSFFSEVENLNYNADLAKLQARAQNIMGGVRTSGRTSGGYSQGPLSSRLSSSGIPASSWSRGERTISSDSRRSSRTSNDISRNLSQLSVNFSRDAQDSITPGTPNSSSKLAQFFGEDSIQQASAPLDVLYS